jgi:mRNA-degrading endonuclease toxin of MazEF toxin-antitoxin module
MIDLEKVVGDEMCKTGPVLIIQRDWITNLFGEF